MNRSSYNRATGNCDKMLLGFDIINSLDTDLKEMSKDNVGEPLHYPNPFLLLFGYIKTYFHFLYLQIQEGLVQGYTKG